MYPEICRIGPLTLHSYGVLIALGVFISLLLMNRAARQSKILSSDKVFDLVFVTVFSGFIGARLFYVIQEWAWYRQHPLEIFQIWKGGLVYYGGMITSFTGFFLFVRAQKLPFFRLSDFILPYIALTHAFGRVGCFLNGCCFGKDNHPVQLYEMVLNLALFGFLSHLFPRRRFDGEVTSLYLIFYPAGRFFLEYLRGDQPDLIFSFTLHQILSLLFVIAGIFIYYGTPRKRT